jgi:hypothetical protein
MNAPFRFTPQAVEDLDAIWWFIGEDNRDAAAKQGCGGTGNCAFRVFQRTPTGFRKLLRCAGTEVPKSLFRPQQTLTRPAARLVRTLS